MPMAFVDDSDDFKALQEKNKELVLAAEEWKNKCKHNFDCSALRDDEIDTLRETIRDKDEIVEARNVVARQEREHVEILKAECETRDKTIANQQTTIRDKAEVIEGLYNEVHKRGEQIDTLSEEVQSQLRERQTERNDKNHERENGRNAVNGYEEQIEELKEENKHHIEYFKKVKAECEAIDKKIIASNALVCEQANTIDELRLNPPPKIRKVVKVDLPFLWVANNAGVNYPTVTSFTDIEVGDEVQVWDKLSSIYGAPIHVSIKMGKPYTPVGPGRQKKYFEQFGFLNDRTKIRKVTKVDLPLVWVENEDGRVSYVTVTGCSDVKVGDEMQVWNKVSRESEYKGFCFATTDQVGQAPSSLGDKFQGKYFEYLGISKKTPELSFTEHVVKKMITDSIVQFMDGTHALLDTAAARKPTPKETLYEATIDGTPIAFWGYNKQECINKSKIERNRNRVLTLPVTPKRRFSMKKAIVILTIGILAGNLPVTDMASGVRDFFVGSDTVFTGEFSNHSYCGECHTHLAEGNGTAVMCGKCGSSNIEVRTSAPLSRNRTFPLRDIRVGTRFRNDDGTFTIVLDGGATIIPEK